MDVARYHEGGLHGNIGGGVARLAGHGGRRASLSHRQLGCIQPAGRTAIASMEMSRLRGRLTLAGAEPLHAPGRPSYRRASYTMLKGVSAARRNLPNPASVTIRRN